MSYTIASNLMDKVDRLIKIIRELKEDAAMVSGPTNAANAAGLGFNPNTETPPVNRKRPPVLARGLMPGARTRWRQGLG